jgi:hypothetical protein
MDVDIGLRAVDSRVAAADPQHRITHRPHDDLPRIKTYSILPVHPVDWMTGDVEP